MILSETWSKTAHVHLSNKQIEEEVYMLISLEGSNSRANPKPKPTYYFLEIGLTFQYWTLA